MRVRRAEDAESAMNFQSERERERDRGCSGVTFGSLFSWDKSDRSNMAIDRSGKRSEKGLTLLALPQI